MCVIQYIEKLSNIKNSSCQLLVKVQIQLCVSFNVCINYQTLKKERCKNKRTPIKCRLEIKYSAVYFYYPAYMSLRILFLGGKQYSIFIRKRKRSQMQIFDPKLVPAQGNHSSFWQYKRQCLNPGEYIYFPRVESCHQR